MADVARRETFESRRRGLNRFLGRAHGMPIGQTHRLVTSFYSPWRPLTLLVAGGTAPSVDYRILPEGGCREVAGRARRARTISRDTTLRSMWVRDSGSSSGRRSSTTDASVVPLISFVATLQNTSFDRVGPWPFNSAMTTGNLRNASRISKGLRPLTPFSPG